METLNQVLIEGGIVKATFASDCPHVILRVGGVPSGFKVMVRMSPKIPAEGLVPGRRLRVVGQLRKDGGLYIMAEHVDFGPKEK